MGRIFEARCVVVAMRMAVIMSLRSMIVRVSVIMFMLMLLGMRVFMPMRCMFVLVTMILVSVTVIVRMLALMLVLMFVSHLESSSVVSYSRLKPHAFIIVEYSHASWADCDLACS